MSEQFPATNKEAATKHQQCEDCGKCREVQDEEFCFVCEYRSCERGEDCKDAA